MGALPRLIVVARNSKTTVQLLRALCSFAADQVLAVCSSAGQILIAPDMGSQDDGLDGDLFIDSYEGLFDDDDLPMGDSGVLGLDDLGDGAAPAAASTADKSVMSPSTNDAQANAPAASGAPRRRRTNNHTFERGAGGIAPPAWHSEAADRQHRQDIILEMYVATCLTQYISRGSDLTHPSVLSYSKLVKRLHPALIGCNSFPRRHASWKNASIERLPL